ncbi:hypothetical protein E1A91_D07G179400v1 [Gossypium mustelinum]|uniref:Uncharacterized protein n=1 Tax=Gossypium mustelinum TaxID=34275 RepID=A0A5D2UAU6_GOSMU|nr:hypothetical protein E1A91_D07G179400v1 [Gossypium mustelinum]
MFVTLLSFKSILLVLIRYILGGKIVRRLAFLQQLKYSVATVRFSGNP